MKAIEAEPLLRHYFNHYAEAYGYAKCRNAEAEGKIFKKVAGWVEKLNIAAKDFIELQLQAVDIQARSRITPNSLFCNKDVCAARLGTAAIKNKTSYENCLAYHSQLVTRLNQAVKLYVPSRYPSKDYLLLDFTVPYPGWFRLLELSNIDTSSIKSYSKSCNTMFKQALEDCRTDSGLTKLLKEKYGTDTDDRYGQRIARWL